MLKKDLHILGAIKTLLDRLRPIVGDRVCKMSQVRIEPECGTPGCHAGWIAIALAEDIGHNYVQGIDILQDLFGCNVRIWAESEAKIWGNSFGYNMFCGSEAFGQIDNAFPATVLVDHWQGVFDRLLDRCERELIYLYETSYATWDEDREALIALGTEERFILEPPISEDDYEAHYSWIVEDEMDFLVAFAELEERSDLEGNSLADDDNIEIGSKFRATDDRIYLLVAYDGGFIYCYDADNMLRRIDRESVYKYVR